MIQKKVCMLGATAVGKTSLVTQFVRRMFSDKYHSSIGITVDKKTLSVGGQDVLLMLWDIYGEDEYQKIRSSYLRGTSGYLLVVDGTRPATLEKAYELRQNVEETIGVVPFVLVLSKCDLVESWALPPTAEADLAARGCPVFRASAKTGVGVEETFQTLAGKMLAAALPASSRP